MSATRTALGGMAAVIGGTALFIALVLALIFGGKSLGWWLQDQNIQHTNKFIQEGQANQAGLKSHLDDLIAQIAADTSDIAAAPAAQRPSLEVARKALAEDACKTASGISATYIGTDRAWRNRNCDGAALSPSSPLARTS